MSLCHACSLIIPESSHANYFLNGRHISKCRALITAETIGLGLFLCSLSPLWPRGAASHSVQGSVSSEITGLDLSLRRGGGCFVLPLGASTRKISCMLGQLAPSPCVCPPPRGPALELSCCDAEELTCPLSCSYLVLEVLDSPGSSPFWNSPWWFGSSVLFFPNRVTMLPSA